MPNRIITLQELAFTVRQVGELLHEGVDTTEL